MKRVVLLGVCIVSISACAMLPVKNNDYYSRAQKKMIEATSSSIGTGFGYDSKLDINYFFFVPGNPASNTNSAAEPESRDTGDTMPALSDGEKAAKSEKYAEAITDYSDSAQYSLYERVFRLYAMLDYLYDYYERKKMWRLYNMMRLNIFPATEYYMQITHHYFKTEKPVLYNRLQQNREKIRREAILFIQKKHTIVDEYY